MTRTLAPLVQRVPGGGAHSHDYWQQASKEVRFPGFVKRSLSNFRTGRIPRFGFRVEIRGGFDARIPLGPQEHNADHEHPGRGQDRAPNHLLRADDAIDALDGIRARAHRRHRLHLSLIHI